MIDHSPSARDPRSHPVATPTTYAHVTSTPLREAVTVTVNPEVTPGTEIVGVLSAVTLSVDDVPVSDDAARSGIVGAAIAVTETDIVPAAFWPTTSDTEYVNAPAVPTKLATGSKVTSPVDRLTLHTPLPSSVIVVFVQFGDTSVPPHKKSEPMSNPVPVSLVSGLNTIWPVFSPEAESAPAVGAVGLLIVADIGPDAAWPRTSVAT